MMLLYHALMIELEPFGAQFRLKGKPESLGYATVGEWLNDQELLDDNDEPRADAENYEIVADPKIIDIYDSEDEYCNNEPRFNGSIDKAAIVVRSKKDDTYWLMLDVNLPEAVIFAQLGLDLNIG